jgi:uncharacterized DUF497 family protein
MEYEWDPAKAKINLRKHRVSFADAALALEDHAQGTSHADHLFTQSQP